MQTRLTAEQITAIVSDTEVNALCFEWASAMVENHTDHIGDFGVDLWGAVCDAAGVDIETGGNIDFSPALVSAEFAGEGCDTAHPSGYNGLIECSVALLIGAGEIGGTSQYIMVEKCVSIETHNRASE